MKALPFSKRPDHRHLFAQVKSWVEGLDLLQKGVHEVLGVEHRYGRNVVDRLVRIELRALPAGLPQGVHEVCADAEQPEFKHLEQPAGTRANYQCIGSYGHRLPGAGSRERDYKCGPRSDTLAA